MIGNIIATIAIILGNVVFIGLGMLGGKDNIIPFLFLSIGGSGYLIYKMWS